MAISGAGQQHGSVYWSSKGEQALESLESSRALKDQLQNGFSYPCSPNWQDASTQQQCDAFDYRLGGESNLAFNTGSKVHHVRCVFLMSITPCTEETDFLIYFLAKTFLNHIPKSNPSSRGVGR